MHMFSSFITSIFSEEKAMIVARQPRFRLANLYFTYKSVIVLRAPNLCWNFTYHELCRGEHYG